MIDQDKMEIDIRKKIEEFEKGSQDTEMQDCVIDAFIQKGLSDSKWAASTKGDEEQVPADKILEKEKTLVSERTAKVAGTSERRNAVPAPRRPVINGSLQGPGNTNKNAAGATNSSTKLRAAMEVEERRQAQYAANFFLCSAATTGAETALSSLITNQNEQYINSMVSYIRAAIAQFLTTGSGSSPPILTPRPTDAIPRERPAVSLTSRLHTQVVRPVVPKPAAKATWATVTSRGQKQSSAPVNVGRTPLKQINAPQTPAKLAAPSTQDERLFPRLGKDHDWRKLSSAGVREAVGQLLSLPPTTIEHVYRVPTGFALRAKDEETRQVLIDLAKYFAPIGAKLEKASDLVVFRISTVPVAIGSLLGRVHITEEMVKNEITRVTNTAPVKVRSHGKSKEGAPYQSWLAQFDRTSAPRPGFRLFDESGIAVRHQPRQTVQQCKRCLQFHGTRGCSRATACCNCSSTMHSSAECKVHTRCRNCGGPHRSDSRDCLARPTRTGPATKEQLLTIRKQSQREFAAVARAKAAVKHADAISLASAGQSQSSQPAAKSHNRFEVLSTEATSTEAMVIDTNPKT
ncbi:hypothetical protein K3495_g6467 [Podosphaera aphanis]|nr:hypothetical protein K3495_g6467 [Podosphaera aphanis]